MLADETRSVVSYRQPFDLGHLMGGTFVLVWDAVVALGLAQGKGAIVLHLAVGVLMTSSYVRTCLGEVDLHVHPSYLRHGTWRENRADVVDVRLLQRLYRNDGDWAEWVVSVRLRHRKQRVLLRRYTSAEDPPPEAISALAFEVAAELLRPVTREVQDDR